MGPVRLENGVKEARGERIHSSRASEWDGYGSRWVAERPQQLWRRHSDAVNVALIRQWLPQKKLRRVLKTDLFDEAVSTGICPSIGERAGQVVGLDVSFSVIEQAAKSCPGLGGAGADVRNLPFSAQSFDAVVSLSTLDHFDSRDDVSAAMREVHRVLAPGGTFILTLDNLANPLIALRNALPPSLLLATGLVPYPVGRTFGPVEAGQLVAEASFEIVEQTAIMHAPRVLAVPVMGAFSRALNGTAASRASRIALAFEQLRGLPSRFVTGHFIAIRAVKSG